MADILPECLIQKILSFCSLKEAAKTSILSKTWLQAWLTLPYLKYSVHLLPKGLYFSKEVKAVDEILERYRDRKIHIDKFDFTFSSCPGERFPVIDKWLDIALKNGVKDLVYTHNFSDCSGYPLRNFYPLHIFKILAAKSLRDLVLEGCDLMDLSLSTIRVVGCHSLRKFSLSKVCLDENMLQSLLNSCPLIVSFNIYKCTGLKISFIYKCTGLKTIELQNLQKIRSLTIDLETDQRVKIQALPTLEHLSYTSDSLEELDILEYKNLKFVNISCFEVYDGFLEHLFTRSQFLESLILERLRLGRFNVCRSRSLRVLKLRECHHVIGEIDAPNLVSIEYEGRHIPDQFKIGQSSQLKHSHLILHLQTNLNAACFCKLRKLLSDSTSWSHVSLRIARWFGKINRKDLLPHHRVAIPQVDVLDVDIDMKSCGDFPILVDALLWSCQPRRLNLSSRVERITRFMDQLMYMKNSSHSDSYDGGNHWQSQLKEVKAYIFDSSNQPVELRSEKLPKMNLAMRAEAYFLLDW